MPKQRARRISLMSSMINRNQGGGNKKQGLVPSVGKGQFGLWNGMRRAGSTPAGRNKVFFMNQLGGVGMGVYQTRTPCDGVKRPGVAFSVGPICCRAFTASCLACAAGVTPAKYCEDNPHTHGCKPAVVKPELHVVAKPELVSEIT